MTSGVYSNAFNFASYQDGRVDLRTGQYSRVIHLATIRPSGGVEASRDVTCWRRSGSASRRRVLDLTWV